MESGVLWEVEDRFGNTIYLTEERWRHIVDGHPEMQGCEGQLRDAVRYGRRIQESANPEKYRYKRSVDGLPSGNTHVAAIVRLGFGTGEGGRIVPNNLWSPPTKQTWVANYD